MNQTEDQLSKEIASRIREAELEVKERSDKIAKDILVQAMQRMAGDFVAEQTKDVYKRQICNRCIDRCFVLFVRNGLHIEHFF